MRYMDFEFDDARLKRAEEIEILSIDAWGQELPEDHYMAYGGSGQEHYLHLKPYFDCDCNDFSWGTNRLCKHLIAALIHTKDELFNAIAVGHRKPVVTFVCGPPASGKSRYIEGLAKREDLVWDFDKVISTITHGVSLHDRPVQTMKIVRTMYDTMLDELVKLVSNNSVGLRAVWIQVMRPPKKQLVDAMHAEVVVMPVSIEDCVLNAQQQGRTPEQIKSVERGATQWWEVYGGQYNPQ